MKFNKKTLALTLFIITVLSASFFLPQDKKELERPVLNKVQDVVKEDKTSKKEEFVDEEIVDEDKSEETSKESIVKKKETNVKPSKKKETISNKKTETPKKKVESKTKDTFNKTQIDSSKKEEPKKEVSKKDEPEKETPKKDTPKKEEPKKDNNGSQPETPSKPSTPVEDKVLTGNLSVNVNTLVNNLDKLDANKHALVPTDGFVLNPKRVEFKEGENVFDVLEREMRFAKIHFDFNFFPAYNSVYIKGINNLYEFDAGPLSGWLYKVNGKIPSYGVSQYELKQGDVIEIIYTLEMGQDVGG